MEREIVGASKRLLGVVGIVGSGMRLLEVSRGSLGQWGLLGIVRDCLGYQGIVGAVEIVWGLGSVGMTRCCWVLGNCWGLWGLMILLASMLESGEGWLMGMFPPTMSIQIYNKIKI